MGSYKWGYKPPIGVINIVILLIALLITTHEPPSRVQGSGSQGSLQGCSAEERNREPQEP